MIGCLRRLLEDWFEMTDAILAELQDAFEGKS